MTDLATLSLAIDSRPVVEAANALDKMGEAAARGESKVGQIRTAADALIAALNRNTVATNAVTAALAQVEAAGGRAGRAISEVGTSAATATTNVVRLDRSLIETRDDLNSVTTTARDATAAWAALGAMGAATAQRLDVARRMASASAVPSASASQQNRSLRADEIQNLTFQGIDVVTSLQGGMNPLTVALQQGGQIAPMFMGEGGVGIGAALRDIGNRVAGTIEGALDKLKIGQREQARPEGENSGTASGALQEEVISRGADRFGESTERMGGAAARLASRIGVVGGAIGGLTAVVVAGVVAQQSYASTQTALAQQLSGVGRAAGVTAGQINALAPAAAAAGSVSVRSAREMAGEFAATGRIGSEMYVGLIGTAKSYAATTGQELPDATKALAAAFSDPVKGADALNKQLGFLDAATRESIETLSAQGDRLGAQRVLFEAYKGSLTNATELTSGWAKVTGAAGRTISDAWDAVGRSVDRVISGGDLETQIETARKALANAQARQDYLPFGLGERDVGTATAYLDTLLAQQARRQAQSRQADLAQRSTAVDDLVKQFNPAQERLKQIEQGATRIRTELAAGVLDPTGESRRTADGLEASARRIREELSQGGSQFANAIREAQFSLRTVGFSPQAQRVAGINERAENEIRGLNADPNDPLLRDFQVNAIRERQRLELETARQQAVYDTSSGSGRYSRGLGQAPEQYRSLYYDAATRYGVNPDLLVAQGYQESRFNPRAVSRAGAQGIAQFMPGTARQYGLNDPFDPAASIDAQGRLMRDLLQRYNGNETAALVAYNAGPRRADRFLASGSDVSTLPDETRGYVRNITTPPPNAEQQIKAQVERNTALDDERQKIDVANRYLDRNGEAYDAATRAQQMLSAAQASGIEITAEYRASVERSAAAMAAASRALASTRAGRDLQFDRDQLGRDRYDQTAYGRARSIYGDVTTPQAQAYVEQARQNAILADARYTLTDAATSFASDLRRGATAADAMTNALGRIADKLINSALDSAIGAAFGGGSGSGNGIGGFLGSIFGGGAASAASPTGGVRLFANGGIMTPLGEVPLRTYARGGIADTPQAAIYGEGSMAEAYVPLPDGRRIPVAMQGGAANGNAATIAAEPPVIINMTGQPVQTERATGPRGPRDTIVIGKTIAGAIANDPDVQKALRAYGLRRTG
ncbi:MULTISPECIES: phage tail length tape measure family protein [Methylorubrum]|uniref:phage tail length tape measure family protein n=1 Tax=Methylorubrum TaxID=2282523 RepID=UPI00209F02E3|nr:MULTISPECIES: phage tail length tape measure family protein [Methylorubrum]MCP1550717.1 soluble lytic murein transglycosylase-like protein [Methylorubrum zatmanii]MCP1552670.1 soluble lytic murein transglycosylase-like protein [Methylorubrum extorquens]MCP1581020.1 soluble lytic murein transglycosylase-like protein [Methylorubrum extorquens]